MANFFLSGLGLGLALLVLGILAFAFLVVLVVGLCKNERGIMKIGGIGLCIFGLLFLLTGALGVMGIIRGAKRVHQKIEQTTAERVAREAARAAKFRALEPDGVTVDPAFYTTHGAWDYYRMPVRYPFVIIAIDDPAFGYLEKERAIDDGVGVDIDMVSDLAVSKHWLLLRTIEVDGFDEMPGSEKWIAFHFDAEEVREFDSLEVLQEAAVGLGFEPKVALKTLRTYFDDL